MKAKYRVVPDWGQSDMFGITVVIDEQAVVAGLSKFIEEQKDKYNPTRDRVTCTLVPAPGSFKKENSEKGA